MKQLKYQQPASIESVVNNVNSEVHPWTLPPHTHPPWDPITPGHQHSPVSPYLHTSGPQSPPNLPCTSLPTHPLDSHHSLRPILTTPGPHDPYTCPWAPPLLTHLPLALTILTHSPSGSTTHPLGPSAP